MKKLFVFLVSLVLLLSFSPVWAGNQSTSTRVEVNLFYSKTCPHCAAEQKFLDKIEKKYSNVEFNRYVYSQNIEKVKSLFEKYSVSKDKFGAVPATFINDRFILGYGTDQTTGAKIENAIKKELGTIENGTKATSSKVVELPLVGKLDTTKYSLPALTAIMGLMDGFNVCSLGALILILGMVLSLKDRTRILLYGGTYLLATAVVYGILIVLWYKLFGLLSSYMWVMKLLIGLLGVGGGIYFLKDYLKFRKEGASCESAGKNLTSKFSKHMKKRMDEDSATLLGIAGLILLFAAVLTVVEFPCSAAVPLVYAGILAGAHLSGLTYLVYIAIFVLFYLLDEIIVFSIAVWKMTVWMKSPKFVTWITLVEALLLFGLGAYYLIGLI